MTVRTTTRSVTFRRPFSLQGVDGLQPAGTYVVETEEEAIPALSFLAYRRLSTTMVLSTRYGGAVVRQVVTIDPTDLEAAQGRDQAGT
jgi:hypothetical protein